MSFIKQALEDAAGCSTCTQSNAVGWKGVQDPSAVVDTEATYNDGKGIKDTVVISGPLSNAYTQALLIALKKEPLQGKEEPPVDPVENKEVTEEDPLLGDKGKNQIGLSTESMQQDDDVINQLFFDLQGKKEELNYLANKFDFVHPDKLPVNVVCNTTLIGMTDFMKIDSFMKFTKDRSNSSTDYVVVVLPDSLNRTAKKTVQHKFIEVQTFDPEQEEKMKEFTAAIEAHVTPVGYKVFTSMESYISYLHGLVEKLRK